MFLCYFYIYLDAPTTRHICLINVWGKSWGIVTRIIFLVKIRYNKFPLIMAAGSNNGDVHLCCAVSIPSPADVIAASTHFLASSTLNFSILVWRTDSSASIGELSGHCSAVTSSLLLSSWHFY